MLEYKVVIDKKTAQQYLDEKNIFADISQMLVMTATEGGKIVGVGAVSLSNDGALIEEISCDDDTIAYGMGKSLLNSLDLGGVKNVSVKNKSIFGLAQRLKFVQNTSETYVLSLEGYFSGGCC